MNGTIMRDTYNTAGVKVSREILPLSKSRDGHLSLVTAIHASA